jgi:hypothetical protein
MFRKQIRENILPSMVKLYCDVSYKQKNDAKNKGARFDGDKKQWYFQYPLSQFIDNPELNTFEYEPNLPVLVNYTGDAKVYNSKVLFNIIYDRYKTFNHIIVDDSDYDIE